MKIKNLLLIISAIFIYLWHKKREDAREKMAEIAAAIEKTLPNSAVVALRGDLGAGKTAFARGFARACGVTEPVTSPT